MNKACVLGIDMGGTNFRIGMVSTEGQVLCSKVDSSQKITASQDAVKSMVEYIDEYIADNSSLSVQAISIGFPSAISKERSYLYSTPNLSGLDNLPITELLSSKIGIPVFIDKDVNHLLLYAIHQHDIDEQGITVGFYFGSGIGNTIFSNGKFWRGKHGVAGEIGHFQLVGMRGRCNCGNIGCVEHYAAGKRLEKIAAKYFPDTSIREVFIRHSDHPVIKQFIQRMTVPVVAEINILDPDTVVLGGGVLNMQGFPHEYFRSLLDMHIRKPYPGTDLNYIYTDANPESGIIGAAISAYRKNEIN